MRKVILFNMVTLDGFFEGPNGEIDWHNADEEFNEFAVHQVSTADGLIFGRVTYELMASYWPTPAAQADDPIVAEKMNTMPKIVFSRTLNTVGWNNTRLVKGDAAEEISKIKQQPGEVLHPPGRQVVDRDDALAICYQSFSQVTADKTGAAGYERSDHTSPYAEQANHG